MGQGSPIQVSFNGGELSPRLEGRVDIDKYASGCRTMDNFIPLVQGGALKRSGTHFVKEVKDSADATVLIPFEFGDTQAYILEFGDQYIRVFKDSGAVLVDPSITIVNIDDGSDVNVQATTHLLNTGDEVFITGSAQDEVNNRYFKVTRVNADNVTLDGEDGTGRSTGAGGTIGEVYTLTLTAAAAAIPYLKADLDGLSFAQSADVLYIAHQDYPPHKLERTDHDAWTLTKIDFDFIPFAPENLDEDINVYVTSDAVDDAVTVYANSAIFTSDMADGDGTYIAISEVLQERHWEWAPASNMGGTPTTNINRAVLLNGNTGIVGDTCFSGGNVYVLRSLVGQTLTGTQAPIHTDGVRSDGAWEWEYLHSGTGYVLLDTFVSTTEMTGVVVKTLPQSAATSYAVNGAIPISSSPILISFFNPSLRVWREGVGSKVFCFGTEDTISTVMNDAEHNITLTSVVPRTNFTTDTDTSGLVHTSGTGTFLHGTNRWAFGAWSVKRGFPRAVTFFEDRLWWAGSKADPQSIWASRTSEYEDHQRSDVDSSAMLLTLQAEKVNVIEWLAAKDELIGGTLGGEFLIRPGTEGQALTPGNIKSVQSSVYGQKASVLPQKVEQVLIFVQRAGTKIRELVFDDATQSFTAPDMNVMADHIALAGIKKIAWAQEPDRILWCVLDDGSLIGFTYDRNQQVTAWHNHTIGGTDVSVESIAVIPHEDGDRDQVWMVVSRTINGGTKRYVEYLEPNWQRTSDITDADFSDSGITYDSGPTTSIVALDHLEGETVKVLGDGLVQDDQTVSGGAITITSASTVQIGLGYNADLETMSIEAGSESGTAQGKTQRITDAVIRMDQTGKGLFYGPDSSTLDEVQLTAGELFDGDTDILPWPGGYEKRARIFIRHNTPLPCTITALMPVLETEDR